MGQLIEVEITCGKCGEQYHEMQEVRELFVILKDSICPFCNNDNSGANFVELGDEQLN